MPDVGKIKRDALKKISKHTGELAKHELGTCRCRTDLECFNRMTELAELMLVLNHTMKEIEVNERLKGERD